MGFFEWISAFRRSSGRYVFPVGQQGLREIHRLYDFRPNIYQHPNPVPALPNPILPEIIPLPPPPAGLVPNPALPLIVPPPLPPPPAGLAGVLPNPALPLIVPPPPPPQLAGLAGGLPNPTLPFIVPPPPPPPSAAPIRPPPPTTVSWKPVKTVILPIVFVLVCIFLGRTRRDADRDDKGFHVEVKKGRGPNDLMFGIVFKWY